MSIHIPNLYADQTILLFRRVLAKEKIDGTRSKVQWNGQRVLLSPGGASAADFAKCFDVEALTEAFQRSGFGPVLIQGEAYGGSMQGLAHRYGDRLRFCAWDVTYEDRFLEVPAAEDFVGKLGLEFTHWVEVSTDLDALDAARDAPSVQAKRNGIVGDQPREGIVLLPPKECLINGTRVIAKHKGDENRETATPRKVVDPSQQIVLENAQAIALEWVTPKRLEHVLDHLRERGIVLSPKATPSVVEDMVADVLREGKDEIVDSAAARKAISRRAAELFNKWVKEQG